MLERTPPSMHSPRHSEEDMNPPYLSNGHYEDQGWGTSVVHSGDPHQRPVNAWDERERAPSKMSIRSFRTTKEYSLITKCFAEFVGDLIFVFVGTMQTFGGNNSKDGVLNAAFAHGLTIFIIAATLGHISGGHFNPAVSLGVTLAGKLPLFHLPCYFVSQILGGICGALLTVSILTPTQYKMIEGGATLLNSLDKIDPNLWYQGLISETVVTFMLVHTILNTAVDTDSNLLAPLAIGMTLTIDILATGPITGASMNPARSFGPNLIGYFFIGSENVRPGWWEFHYIYWAGPIMGASIAAAVYWMLQAREKRVVP